MRRRRRRRRLRPVQIPRKSESVNGTRQVFPSNLSSWLAGPQPSWARIAPGHKLRGPYSRETQTDVGVECRQSSRRRDVSPMPERRPLDSIRLYLNGIEPRKLAATVIALRSLSLSLPRSPFFSHNISLVFLFLLYRRCVACTSKYPFTVCWVLAGPVCLSTAAS